MKCGEDVKAAKKIIIKEKAIIKVEPGNDLIAINLNKNEH